MVTGAAGDGIGVATTGDGPVAGTVVTGNLVFGSTGDGIHIAAPATTVMRNVTVRNTGYGIEATAGVHDGGGNVTAANGPPAQCVNVRCLPRQGQPGRAPYPRGVVRRAVAAIFESATARLAALSRTSSRAARRSSVDTIARGSRYPHRASRTVAQRRPAARRSWPASAAPTARPRPP